MAFQQLNLHSKFGRITNGSAWISSNSNEYVIRGIKSSAKSCRSAARKNSAKVYFYKNKPIYSSDSAGFRVVCC